ncbi:MAG: type II secretion system F family protein [Gordonia sp. (in: high G+C Gram-positive bacteria)]|uniref:type II secretion system F family protein n=1 Tax=Gordonia sp. (in: high G+C Gram-positive bacteria) TaxID=84139 RepID=UPI0039E3AEF5
MIAAAVLVAAACLIWPGPGSALARVVPEQPRSGSPWRLDGEPRWLRSRVAAADPFETAAAYDLFAVCLRAGLPVATSAAVAAEHAPGVLAEGLRRAAELLALGAVPEKAWALDSAMPQDDRFAELATLARRASRAGSSLADGVAALAEATREQAQTEALARAERAGVTISGPLGLCFLPAFVCLGIVPVVVGLSGGMLGDL